MGTGRRTLRRGRSAGGDHGAGLAEYAGLVVLAALILGALVATGITGKVESGVSGAVCKIFDGQHCGTSTAAQPVGGKNPGGQAGNPSNGSTNDRRGNERDARNSRRGRHGGQDNQDNGTPGQPTPANPLGQPVNGTKVPEPRPPAWKPPDKGAGKYNSEHAGPADYALKLAIESAANAAAGPLPHASSNLLHYLANDGKPLQLDVNQLLKDVPDFRNTVNQDRKFFGMWAVDKAKKRGAKGPITYPINTRWHGYYIDQSQSNDWFYATGGFSYNQTGKVTVYPPDKPGDKWRYEVSTRVNYRDRYNWDANQKKKTPFGPATVSDKTLAELHRKGLAQEYTLYGRSDEQTSKGER